YMNRGSGTTENFVFSVSILVGRLFSPTAFIRRLSRQRLFLIMKALPFSTPFSHGTSFPERFYSAPELEGNATEDNKHHA
ncbi:hypothetical protein, partial [Alkalibacillus haloalkaliphilus]|uniref:hypothetical protein n=1 Tax=Alkalibacillus haloalkaliphilus TaxID=94136 RepID=UPI002935EFBD